MAGINTPALAANVSVSNVSLNAGDNTIGRVKITDGTDTATVRDVTGAQALDVSIVDGSGNQVTSFGGGTQYAEGATAATATGTVAMGKSGTTVKAVQTDSSGNLRVDLSQTSANATAIKVDGSAVTQPVSGTVAVTNAGLTALNGAISGTEVQVDVVGALPAGTNAIGKLSANDGVDIGNVDVASIAAGDNNIGNVDIATVPSDPFGANADAAATAGSTGSMQAKFRLMTSQLDAIKTAVETLDNTVSGSELQVDIVGSLPAGTNAIGKLSANSGVDIGDVDVTSIAAGDNNIGNVDIASLPGDVEADIDQIRDQIDAHTTGATTMNATSSDGATALTNSAQAIKASAGRLLGYFIYNPNAAAAFVQFYNTAAASVTVGTTNPLFMLSIPAGAAANLWMGEDGPNFSNAGWSWAATSTAGGSGALGTALDAVAWYK